MDFQITEDGSHTLFSDMAGQTYHSSHGAVTESKHIFIGAGLDFSLARSGTCGVSVAGTDSSDMPLLRVLEIGFGTGLNDILTAVYAADHGVRIDMSTVDLYPLSEDVYSALNYGCLLGCEQMFLKIHGAPWSGYFTTLSPNFNIRKYRRDIVEFLSELASLADSEERFDVIYFDAFSPDAQPELWTADVFRNLYAVSANGGVLTTYCSKGDVRRSMIAAGYKVEKLQGPPGKRHILRAVK